MTLFHIGYEGLSFDEFLTYLKYYHISAVVDVRNSPVSRKKGFSKTVLSNNLAEQDIEYIHLQKLGTPKPLRDKLYKDHDYEEFFPAYREYLLSHTDELDSLLDIVNSMQNVLLLCYEKDPERCHRSIVAEEAKKRNGKGLKVEPVFRTDS